MSRQLLERDHKGHDNSECCTGQRKSENIFDSNHVSIEHSGQLFTAEDTLNLRCSSGQDPGRVNIGGSASKCLQQSVGEDGLRRRNEVGTTNGIAHWSQG